MWEQLPLNVRNHSDSPYWSLRFGVIFGIGTLGLGYWGIFFRLHHELGPLPTNGTPA